MSSAEPSESLNQNTRDLRAETQGMVTFYHSLSTPGYWFSAGEIESMIDIKATLNLPERNDGLTVEEEYGKGPVECPRCGSGSKLFEMRSYLASEVRMRACHVCHGRWVGHQSLEILLEHIQFRGFLGKIKKLFHGGKRTREKSLEA